MDNLVMISDKTFWQNFKTEIVSKTNYKFLMMCKKIFCLFQNFLSVYFYQQYLQNIILTSEDFAVSESF